eukprot:286492_1
MTSNESVEHETLMGSEDDGLMATIPLSVDCPYFDQTFFVTNDEGLDSEVTVYAPIDGTEGCGIKIESWSVPRVFYTEIGSVQLQTTFTIGGFDNAPSDTDTPMALQRAIERFVREDDVLDTLPQSLYDINYVQFDGIVYVSQRIGSNVLYLTSSAAAIPFNQIKDEINKYEPNE